MPEGQTRREKYRRIPLGGLRGSVFNVLAVAALIVGGFFAPDFQAQGSTNVNFLATSGSDVSTGVSVSSTANDVTKLDTSDDSRIQSNGPWPNNGSYDEEKYIEFVFSPNVPTNAVISSVVITHEWRRSGTLTEAKLEVWDGNFANYALSLPGSSNQDFSEDIDVTSLINTPVKVNDLKARFLAYRGAGADTKTSHDFIKVTVAYNVAPIITNIQTDSITAAGVTITWTTDKNADSQIEYGLTSDYGSSTGLNPALTTSHAEILTGLAANTAYHFRVKSKDGDNNLATSGDQTFTTALNNAAVLAVTQISAVQSFAVGDNTFANGWRWVFDVTLPINEASVSMKFGDWISGGNSIPAAGNVRFYSAQSANHNSSASPVTVSAANAHTSSDPMIIDAGLDLHSSIAGRQIQITVEGRVPSGSAAGSYSSSYGIKSN